MKKGRKGIYDTLKEFFSSADEHEESVKAMSTFIQHMVETMNQKLWGKTIDILRNPPDPYSDIVTMEAILNVASENPHHSRALIENISRLNLHKESILEKAMGLRGPIFNQVLQTLNAA